MGNREKQRLKRLKKKKEQARRAGVSPYVQAAKSGRIEFCVVNAGWRDEGRASIMVVRRRGDGGLTLGAFLIDTECAGLKDAWGRLDISANEVEDTLGSMAASVGSMEIAPEKARQMLAAGVRLAHDNGFRLPARYERWTALLGGVADWPQADLKVLGLDGRYRWAGSLAELRDNLIGCSVEQFMARKDVEFLFGPDMRGGDHGLFDLDEEDVDDDDVDDDDDGDGEEDAGADAGDDTDRGIDEMFAQCQKSMADDARRWLMANGEAPHPRLDEAVGLQVEATLQVGNDVDPDDSDEISAAALDNVNALLDMESPDSAQELTAATEQLGRYVSHFATPEEMFSHLMPDMPKEKDSPQ